MHIVNLHHAPPMSINAALTYAVLLHHTGRLDELNFQIQNEIRHHEMTRERLEATIERLISALDSDDGDPDLEPYLAGSDPKDADREGVAEATQSSPWDFRRSLTQFDEDWEDDGTAEPSLGAPEGHPDTHPHGFMAGRPLVLPCSQEHWPQGTADDSELDLADVEDTAPERAGGGFVFCSADDEEPWLGAAETGLLSTFGYSQSRWGRTGTDDRETEHDGPADRDALAMERGEAGL